MLDNERYDFWFFNVFLLIASLTTFSAGSENIQRNIVHRNVRSLNGTSSDFYNGTARHMKVLNITLKEVVAHSEFKTVKMPTTMLSLKLDITMKSTSPPMIVKLDCRKAYSCNKKCTDGVKFTVYSSSNSPRQEDCNCDHACNEVFGDCCGDFERSCPIAKKNLTNLFDYFPQHNAWRCVYFPIHGDGCSTEPRGSWMIAGCPNTWPDDHVKFQCHHPVDKLHGQTYRSYLPVVSISNLLSYRNQYCAQCNNVSIYEHWTMIFNEHTIPPPNYSPSDFTKFISKYSNELVGLQPKEGQRMRRCTYFNVITSCPNSTTMKNKQKCAQGTVGLVQEMHSREKIFKNRACASCNGYNLVCGVSKTGVDGCLVIPGINRALSLRDYGLSTRIESCRKNEAFDKYIGRCRKIYDINELNRGNDDVYQLTLFMLRNPNIGYQFFLFELKASLSDYYSLNKSQISEINILPTTSSEGPAYQLSFNIRLTPLLSFVLATNRELNNSSNETITLRRLFRFRQAFQLRLGTSSTSFTVYRQEIRQVNCTRPHSYNPHEYVIQEDLSIRILSTNVTYEQYEYFVKNLTSNATVTVCLKTTPYCSAVFIQLNSTEFYLTDNLTLVYNSLSFKLGDYVYRGEKFYVCVDFTRNYEISTRKWPKDHIALVVITWIGFISSIVCLIVLIITYCAFKDLRNLPGKNLLNLSFTLCMAEILWLVGSFSDEYSAACAIIARANHYFFLAFFSSCFVIAFHSCMVFGRKLSIRRTPSEEKKIFFKYCLVVWLLPAIFLIIFGILDHIDVLVIDYGRVDACWLGTKKSKILLFIVPFGIILLLNLALFIAVSLRLRENRKTNLKQLGVDGRKRAVQNVKVCIRLSTLMGFSWLFGLLQIVTEDETDVFAYVFVIFVSFQGLFICVAFLFRKKCYELYRSFVSKKLTSSKEKSTRTTGFQETHL